MRQKQQGGRGKPRDYHAAIETKARENGSGLARVASRLGHTVATGTVLASVLGCFGFMWWILDLLANFRIQYVVILLAAMVISVWLRNRNRAVFYGLGLALNISLVAPLFMANEVPGKLLLSQELRLVAFNVWNLNPRPDEIINWLEDVPADLILLQEVVPDFRERLAILDEQYSRFGWGGNYFLVPNAAKATLHVQEVRQIEFSEGKGVALVLRHHGLAITVLGLHCSAPTSGREAGKRDAQFVQIKDWVKQQTLPVIVLGDLNATPWSSGFRRLVETSGLVNSLAGHGLGRSWPMQSPGWLSWPFRIPIDHCLHGPEFLTVERRVGPAMGSTHRPLYVTLH